MSEQVAKVEHEPGSFELTEAYMLQQAWVEAQSIPLAYNRIHYLAQITGRLHDPEEYAAAFKEVKFQYSLFSNVIDNQTLLPTLQVSIANSILDPTLMEGLQPYDRDHIQAQIAAQYQDPNLAPATNEFGGLDAYYENVAYEDKSPYTAAHIENPGHRVDVLEWLVGHAEEVDDHEYATAARLLLWQSIHEIEDAAARDAYFCNHANSIAEIACISNPGIRLNAYYQLIANALDTGSANEEIEAIKAAAIEYLESIPFPDRDRADAIGNVAILTRDIGLALTLSDQAAQNRALTEISLDIAVASLDTDAVLNTDYSHKRDAALYQIILKTGDHTLARNIRQPHYRAKALAAASSGASADYKRAIQQQALQLSIESGDLHPTEDMHDQLVADCIVATDDRSFVWGLLDDPRINNVVLIRVAETFHDVLLLSQISPDTPREVRMRDAALQSAALHNGKPEAIAYISNAESRVSTYLGLADQLQK